MKTLGVQELTERINEILSLLQAGETIELTNDGEVVGHLTPPYRLEQKIRPYDKEASDKAWADLERLSAEISAHWTGNMDAVEAVRDARRDL